MVRAVRSLRVVVEDLDGRPARVVDDAVDDVCRACRARETTLEAQLAAAGWRRAASSGRHGQIYVDVFDRRVVKLVRPGWPSQAERHVADARACWSELRRIAPSHVPLVHSISLCFDGRAAALIHMENAGVVNCDIPAVTRAHIRRAARSLSTTRLFSTDVVTITSSLCRVNTGNVALAFSDGVLRATLIDVDDVGQFYRLVDRRDAVRFLARLWAHVIELCLQRPVVTFPRPSLQAHAQALAGMTPVCERVRGAHKKSGPH